MEKTRKKTKRPPTQARAARPRSRVMREEIEGARLGRRNIILFLAALAAILLGFVLLAHGSMSLSAILLVGGYLVLVPWALLADGVRRDSAEPEEEKAEVR